MTEVFGAATVMLVRDVDESMSHYRDKLGFEVFSFDENPTHYGFANRGEAWFHFAHWDGVEPRPNATAVPPDMFEAYLYVDDVTALHEELVGRGANVLHGPEERPWTQAEIRVQDPDGYVIAFGERQDA
jgi:catechol 2,3-dioxygenase-like lactoylglutathione lyase family enzyme